MRIALTGATGFLGRYIANDLTAAGHTLRAWHRPTSDRGGFTGPDERIEWLPGQLGADEDAAALVAGCDSVVHSAVDWEGLGRDATPAARLAFAERNVVGTLRLIEAARAAGARRFIYISSCAVHEVISPDRPLDEAHPLWPTSHYGAHKAAVEAFVHSYGFGSGYEICSLRPTGIYGLARPASESRWYPLVKAVARGEDVTVRGGGKEVHAADVARAVAILLEAPGIAGQSYNCYDRYVSEFDVATLARKLSGTRGRIVGEPTRPKNQIVTDKLRALGMTFGGDALLERTIGELLAAD